MCILRDSALLKVALSSLALLSDCKSNYWLQEREAIGRRFSPKTFQPFSWVYFIYLSVGNCFVCSRQALNSFLPQSIDDLDINPAKAHRCQPRLWLSPLLKCGIWGKIHINIPKFRHVVESSAWGTRKKQGKGIRTSEMVTFQACLITDLSWLQQKLWHHHLHGDSCTCRTAWLALPGAAISLPLALQLAQSHVGSQIATPTLQKVTWAFLPLLNSCHFTQHAPCHPHFWCIEMQQQIRIFQFVLFMVQPIPVAKTQLIIYLMCLL